MQLPQPCSWKPGSQCVWKEPTPQAGVHVFSHSGRPAPSGGGGLEEASLAPGRGLYSVEPWPETPASTSQRQADPRPLHFPPGSLPMRLGEQLQPLLHVETPRRPLAQLGPGRRGGVGQSKDVLLVCVSLPFK